jgi:hypothetical protein
LDFQFSNIDSFNGMTWHRHRWLYNVTRWGT